MTEGNDALVRRCTSRDVEIANFIRRPERALFVQVIAPEDVHGTRNRPGAPGSLLHAPVLGLAPDIDDDRLLVIDRALNIETRCQEIEIRRSFERGRRRRRFCRVRWRRGPRQAYEALARRGPRLRPAVKDPDVRVTKNCKEPDCPRRPGSSRSGCR